MKLKRLQDYMYACGRVGPPKVIECLGRDWELETVYKHDFFACTGRYLCIQTQERVVLKINRVQSFFGIPFVWIGRFLCKRETEIIRRLKGVGCVPNVIKRYGKTGFVYDYIEGQSLDEYPAVPDDFFDDLKDLLGRIHRRKICYMDMNKRGNIIVGKDGRPSLIDFQISMFLPGKLCGPLRRAFQKEDFYHLLKHKRRFRPDILTELEDAHVKCPSVMIRIHRFVACPFQRVRRPILGFLYRKKILKSELSSNRSPENDPRRFYAG